MRYWVNDDDVKLDNMVYKIEVCVTAPNGEVVDKFVAARIIGIYKKMLDADFAAERDE